MVLLCCLTISGALGEAALQTGRAEATPSTWSITPSPEQGSATNDFFAVSCSSSSNCVAVGTYINESTYQTLIESWNGATWSVAPSPNPVGNDVLEGVSCASATICVAVGYQNTQTLIESWNGATWSVTPSPNASGNDILGGISCISATSCVAVGNYVSTTAQGTLVESWNGTGWSITSSPNPSSDAALSGVSCTSPSSCKAVGTNGNSTLIESSNGTTWSVMSTLAMGSGENDLEGVSCVTSSTCVAVGGFPGGSAGVAQTLIESWNGATWSVTTSQNASGVDGLFGVSCAGTGGCVAVGTYLSESKQVNQTLIETTETPDFALVATPASQTIATSSTATVSISVAPTGGFDEPVVLTYQCLAGCGALQKVVFGAPSVVPGQTSTLLVSTTTVTPPLNVLTLTVIGTSASGLSHYVDANFTISPVTGVENTISLTGSALDVGTSGNCLLIFTTYTNCFSIQQNFWVNDGIGTSISDYWWVQNVMLVFQDLGVWSVATSYNGYNGASLLLPNPSPDYECGGIDSDCEYGDASVLGTVPLTDLQLTSLISNGHLVLNAYSNGTQLSSFTVASFPSGTPLSLPNAFVSFSTPKVLEQKGLPQLDVVGEANMQTATFTAAAGTLQSSLQINDEWSDALTQNFVLGSQTVTTETSNGLGWAVPASGGSATFGNVPESTDPGSAESGVAYQPALATTALATASATAGASGAGSTEQADHVSASFTGGAGTTVTVENYGSNPIGLPTFSAGEGISYFDLFLAPPDASDSVTLIDCAATPGQVQWWNDSANGGLGAWDTVSSFAISRAPSGFQCPGKLDMTLDAYTTPNISELTGTVFGVGTGSLQITTPSQLPNGVVKVSYREKLAASGGNPPYRWSVSSGHLPDGLHLKKTSGVIAGKAKKQDRGIYTFTVKVVDKKIRTKHHPATQNTATKTLSLTIS